ncbi:MAG: DEAD/DEAH box helicase family protein [Solirubrobacteraceae bacterium]|nr:DEAD/DEAH box helicase family protein [Solirubrobacteraceae bacterium]
MTVDITHDDALIAEVAARFDLREPNRRALDAVVKALAEDGRDSGGYPELVADLATGVGKTYLMSSLVDYAAAQGVRHVLVVTPGSVIQNKTLANFDVASAKYVGGADHEPVVITPENFRAASVGAALRDPDELKVFVFNVQQLIRPTDKVSRKVRDTDENLGDDLYSHLENAGDLLVIADEHHIYHERAKAFSAAIRDLNPVALVGLTATPAKSDLDKVVFQYTLGEAIADGHVKTPVIVYRKDGTKDEHTQLADACHLLRKKDAAYRQLSATRPDLPHVKPVLFVVCTSIDHATDVGQRLAQDGFIGDPGAVLEITSQSSDEALTALAACEAPDSPIRAIVSVNMLREGWDVRNIAVIVALRKLASQGLTEQILGRGLRLPFGELTGVPTVDQVDLVAHDSYRQLLAQKDALRERIESPPAEVEVDEHGAAGAPGGVTQTGQAAGGDGDLDADDQAGGDVRDDGARGPRPFTFTESHDDGGTATPTLFGQELKQRVATPSPQTVSRTPGAPQINFPRREPRLTVATFSLSDIPDGDAQAAGARFITEVPTFLARDELTAVRGEDDNVTIKVRPQQHVEAQQTLSGIDTIRADLVAAMFRLVAETATEKRAARRITNAFLKGAGVVTGDETAEWGENRRQQAIAGMRSLIKAALARQHREMTYALDPITLPIEPVIVEAPLDAYSDPFVKHLHYGGWQRNVMPIASFDAGTTEWAIAHLLDRDDEIRWWLRLYTSGPAFIRTPRDGDYFPDFIAIDAHGSHWVIEGKSDKHSQDADVLRKKEAAERWARAVRDEGGFGDWHYVFATESDIKQAAGSWVGLKVATDPE